MLKVDLVLAIKAKPINQQNYLHLSASAPVGLRPQVAAVAPAVVPACCQCRQPSMRSSLLSSVPGLPVEPTVGLSRPQVARSGSRTPRTLRKQVPHRRTEAAAIAKLTAQLRQWMRVASAPSDVPVERLQDAEGNPPPEAPGEVRKALRHCCSARLLQ